jgi:3-oxoacyl-[acyl-carrier-protein] synthase II
MANQQKRRVVVTGMGAITPLGNTIDTIWDNLLQGRSGIGYFSIIPPEERTCKIGGECTDFTPENYMDKKEARRMDRFTQFAIRPERQPGPHPPGGGGQQCGRRHRHH